MKPLTALVTFLLTTLEACAAPVIRKDISSPQLDIPLDLRNWSDISLTSINTFRPPPLNPNRTVITFDIPPPLYSQFSTAILTNLAALKEPGSFQLFSLHQMRHVDQHIATFHFGAMGKLKKVERLLTEQDRQEIWQGKDGFVFNASGEEYLRRAFGERMHEVLRLWFEVRRSSLLWQGSWDGAVAMAGR